MQFDTTPMNVKDTNKSVLQEQWYRPIIPLLIIQSRKGWGREFRQIACREIEWLAVRGDEQEHHG